MGSGNKSGKQQFCGLYSFDDVRCYIGAISKIVVSARHEHTRQLCSIPNKLTSVFHASVLLLIMHGSRHNLVKVAVDPRGDSRVEPQTLDNVMMKFIVNSRTDALKTDINLFFTIQIVKLSAPAL